MSQTKCKGYHFEYSLPRSQGLRRPLRVTLILCYQDHADRDGIVSVRAAKIFDRLELKVLLEVASQINPRRMSDILALMSPEGAERLTVELANRFHGAGKTPSPADLPKIVGRPPA